MHIRVEGIPENDRQFELDTKQGSFGDSSESSRVFVQIWLGTPEHDLDVAATLWLSSRNGSRRASMPEAVSTRKTFEVVGSGLARN